MGDSKKIADLMQDPDWIQRWPRGEQRREAIKAHLADEEPAPMTTEKVKETPKKATKGKGKAKG